MMTPLEERDFRIQRMKAHYSGVFPPFASNEDKTFFSRYIVPHLQNLKGNLIFYSAKDFSRAIGWYLLAQEPRLISFQMINCYYLIEIYLSKHEEYQSIFDLIRDVSYITMGFHEFTNKQTSNIIIQHLEEQTFRNKRTWYFYKGTKAAFATNDSPFLGVSQAIKEFKFTEVDLNPYLIGVTSVKSQDEESSSKETQYVLPEEVQDANEI